jgi:uncharacterized OB-fold protein
MGLHGEYLGMQLSVDDLDRENIEYFRWCATHEYRLQSCNACSLLRYPPTTACPWCTSPDASWVPVAAKGAVYSYTEVHHAIQPAFKRVTPYLALLVELDTQRGLPGADEALRVMANLALPNGDLAPPDVVRSVGIGTRVRMVFKDVAPGFALPMWTIDEGAPQPAAPWRYPIE